MHPTQCLLVQSYFMKCCLVLVLKQFDVMVFNLRKARVSLGQGKGPQSGVWRCGAHPQASHGVAFANMSLHLSRPESACWPIWKMAAVSCHCSLQSTQSRVSAYSRCLISADRMKTSEGRRQGPWLQIAWAGLDQVDWWFKSCRWWLS